MLSFDEIEARRRVHGIRQVALAKRAGINQATYSSMKKKQGKMPRGPSEDMLTRLEGALNELIAETKGNGQPKKPENTVLALLRDIRDELTQLSGRESIMESRMGALEKRFGGLEGRFSALEERMIGIEERLGRIENGLSS